jgi:hypothetical protein
MEQITVIRDGVRRTVLRVRRHGYFIAEVRNIEERGSAVSQVEGAVAGEPEPPRSP